MWVVGVVLYSRVVLYSGLYSVLYLTVMLKILVMGRRTNDLNLKSHFDQSQIGYYFVNFEFLSEF